MIQRAPGYAAASLRAVTYRIANTSTADLPRHAAQLAASIWTCRDLLSLPADALKQDADSAVVVHRFKTQLATLLQDRTVEGRFAGVCLTRTAIEAGGVEILSKSNAWVRHMLSILKRPDPSATRVIAVLTLTRIFMLTWDYAALVREITTPALPTFVSTCLINADHTRCSTEELQVILEAFEVLMPRHPTIFRTIDSALRAFLLRLLTSPASHTAEHLAAAQRLLASLSLCVPKQGGAERWDQSLQDAIKATHQTCDVLFTPVLEDWRSSVEAFKDHGSTNGTTIETTITDTYGLGAWRGVFAGADRVIVLLNQIRSHIETVSPGTVSVRIGMVMDLVSRLSSVTAPGQNKHTSIRLNPQIGRDERDALFACLPEIHTTTLQLLISLVTRLGMMTKPVTIAILETASDIFTAESYDTSLRTATYHLLRLLLEQSGSGLMADEVGLLNGIITACCSDSYVVPEDSTPKSNASVKAAEDLAIGLTTKADPSHPVVLRTLHTAAAALLPLLLASIDTALVPRRLRTLMDRTAILTSNKASMLASVLNPPSNPSGHGLQTSILPFLVRQFPHDAEVEALVRPRMPYVKQSANRPADLDEDEVMEEDDDAASPETAADHAIEVEDDMQATDHVAIRPVTASPDKRPLDMDVQDGEAKRVKHTTASSQLQSEWQQSLTEVATNTIVQSQPSISQSVYPQAAASRIEVDEDDIDFEMPPLTMEQDTDDDDE